MFSAPFISRQPQSKARPITLGWPQFVAVVVGVCTVVVVGAIVSMHDIYEVVFGTWCCSTSTHSDSRWAW
jgi:hypothetical protein